MTKPSVGEAKRALPPSKTYQYQVGQCPICGRIAFTVVEVTIPSLVGQKPKARLVGLECPWCLHLLEFDEEGKPPKISAFPVDLASQIRAGLNKPPATDSAETPMQQEIGDASVPGQE